MKTDFARWASASPSWAAGFELGPVLSTRLRIARNLAGLPFPHNAPLPVQREIVQRVFDAVPASPAIAKGLCIRLNELTVGERSFLMERQLISHQHALEEGDRGLVVASGELLSIMVNEEDHLRAAIFRPGAGVDDAWQTLSAIDDQLSARLPMAYLPDLGFTTACPTNVGTGLRVSCLVHLPAAVLSNRVGPVLEALARAGLTARGFYGEGTSAVGDLFQISNAVTIGRSEAQLIRDVEKAVRQVAAIELKETAALMAGDSRRAMEDRVYRAYGTLSHARLLDYPEGMRLLSLVRLGLRSGLAMEATADMINDLVFLTQATHLRLRSPKRDAVPEAALRADVFRERLSRR